MDSFQPSSQNEDHSPQSNSSGYPLEVAVNEEMPGSSDARPPPQSLGLKRNREWSSEDEDQEEDKETAPKADHIWEVVTLRGLKMKLKRRRVSAVQPEYHKAFQRLLEDPVINRFLAWDTKLRVSDKYLLSMVVAYFGRAGLFAWQYQRIHFFLALYLANDMEEEDEAPKRAIFSFLYGNDRSRRPFFHKQRFQFFRSMGYNARVSKEECEEIMAFNPELWVWGRERALPEATEA